MRGAAGAGVMALAKAQKRQEDSHEGTKARRKKALKSGGAAFIFSTSATIAWVLGFAERIRVFVPSCLRAFV